MIDLRLGRWQDVLADVSEAQILLTDPPYSARTHKGQLIMGQLDPTINYVEMTEDHAALIAHRWAPRDWRRVLRENPRPGPAQDRRRLYAVDVYGRQQIETDTTHTGV